MYLQSFVYIVLESSALDVVAWGVVSGGEIG